MSNQASGGGNPCAEQPDPSLNPYASPTGGYEIRPHSPSDFARQLRIPAIGLLVLSILTVLYRAGDLIFTVIYLSNNGNPNVVASVMIRAIIGTTVVLAMNVTVLLGSIAMLRLTSHGLARAAAIMAVIPLCSPGFILGIPFGIWALVVLSKPGCAASFASASVPARPY